MANEAFDPKTVSAEESPLIRARCGARAGVESWLERSSSGGLLGRYTTAAGLVGLGGNNYCCSRSYRGLSAIFELLKPPGTSITTKPFALARQPVLIAIVVIVGISVSHGRTR